LSLSKRTLNERVVLLNPIKDFIAFEVRSIGTSSDDLGKIVETTMSWKWC
jgi:hypothetical protein